ncbi:MAG: DNA replication and repair protein RecF [Candidatus Dojkabacteria bacterium]|jgi:DNA replication and repair protein RecF|nr:DNA replication and repair protein RecF [Candidatus Dojkabacteria bacterium]MDD2270170.1 DNA replication and repair protein RecF [Candidatus Dojkabacteria bacterium]
MIKRLKLKNFRKFKDLELHFDSSIVLLHGDNAQGKSSILEAIYIAFNGKSPWSGADEYVHNNQNGSITKHSRIEIEVDEKTYAHYKDNNRKIYMIDNHKTTSKKFFSPNSATIFNPEKIDLLMLSPTRRRDFLDETISSFNYEYSSVLKRYSRLIHQRNSYLKKLSKQFYEKGIIARNDPQLNFWTRQLAELASEIYKERILIIHRLKEKDFEIQYCFCQDRLNGIPGFKGDQEKIKDIINTVLEENKKRDIATGYSNIGPHRDDWRIFTDQDIKKYGSRGQKRLAIGNLIFRTHEMIAQEIGYYPTLLLDDIASELDQDNTTEIFDKQIIGKQQTFITTVDPKILPKYLQKDTQFIDLNKV